MTITWRSKVWYTVYGAKKAKNACCGEHKIIFAATDRERHGKGSNTGFYVNDLRVPLQDMSQQLG